MKNYSSTGIIGGADGPTTIYLTTSGPSPMQMLVLIMLGALAVGFVAGYLYKRWKSKPLEK